MRRVLAQFLCFITLLSCVDHEFLPDDPMVIACAKCGRSRSEMQWLETLIDSIKANTFPRGAIYAVPYYKHTLFHYQPMGYYVDGDLTYDCHGNQINSIDIQKLREGMRHAIMIYSSFPD